MSGPMISKHVLYHIQIVGTGLERKVKLEEFDTEEEARTYRERLLIFRPKNRIDIEIVMREAEKPTMTFMERLRESDRIAKELKQLREGTLEKGVIEERFNQLIGLLETNKIYRATDHKMEE